MCFFRPFGFRDASLSLGMIPAQRFQMGKGFLTKCSLQPIRYGVGYEILRSNVKMVAVGDDRDLAWTGAVFFETFRRIIFFWLPVATDEQHRTFDPLGVFHEIGRVGETVEIVPRRNHPPPGGDEHELARFAGGDQSLCVLF